MRTTQRGKADEWQASDPVVEDVPADGAPALLMLESESTDGGREMLPLPVVGISLPGGITFRLPLTPGREGSRLTPQARRLRRWCTRRGKMGVRFGWGRSGRRVKLPRDTSADT
jgi:hypothetical protein